MTARTMVDCLSSQLQSGVNNESSQAPATQAEMRRFQIVDLEQRISEQEAQQRVMRKHYGRRLNILAQALGQEEAATGEHRGAGDLLASGISHLRAHCRAEERAADKLREELQSLQSSRPATPSASSSALASGRACIHERPAQPSQAAEKQTERNLQETAEEDDDKEVIAVFLQNVSASCLPAQHVVKPQPQEDPQAKPRSCSPATRIQTHAASGTWRPAFSQKKVALDQAAAPSEPGASRQCLPARREPQTPAVVPRHNFGRDESRQAAPDQAAAPSEPAAARQCLPARREPQPPALPPPGLGGRGPRSQHLLCGPATAVSPDVRDPRRMEVVLDWETVVPTRRGDRRDPLSAGRLGPASAASNAGSLLETKHVSPKAERVFPTDLLAKTHHASPKADGVSPSAGEKKLISDHSTSVTLQPPSLTPSRAKIELVESKDKVSQQSMKKVRDLLKAACESGALISALKSTLSPAVQAQSASGDVSCEGAAATAAAADNAPRNFTAESEQLSRRPSESATRAVKAEMMKLTAEVEQLKRAAADTEASKLRIEVEQLRQAVAEATLRGEAAVTTADGESIRLEADGLRQAVAEATLQGETAVTTAEGEPTVTTADAESIRQGADGEHPQTVAAEAAESSSKVEIAAAQVQARNLVEAAEQVRDPESMTLIEDDFSHSSSLPDWACVQRTVNAAQFFTRMAVNGELLRAAGSPCDFGSDSSVIHDISQPKADSKLEASLQDSGMEAGASHTLPSTIDSLTCLKVDLEPKTSERCAEEAESTCHPVLATEVPVRRPLPQLDVIPAVAGRTSPPSGAVALEWGKSEGKPLAGYLEAQLWEVEAAALAQLLMTKAVFEGSCMHLRVHDLGGGISAAAMEMLSDGFAGFQEHGVPSETTREPLQVSRLLHSQVLTASPASVGEPEAACTAVPEAFLLEGLRTLQPVAVRVRLVGDGQTPSGEAVEAPLSERKSESQDETWGKPLVLVSLGPALAAVVAQGTEAKNDTMGIAKIAAALCAALRSSSSDASLRKNNPGITMKAWR